MEPVKNWSAAGLDSASNAWCAVVARGAADDGLVGSYPIDTGTAEIEKDSYGANRYVLKVNGVPSSHIDLDDPEFLDFEYMKWMEPLILAAFEPARFDGRARKLRALHLGGGGCSMPRWAAARYENARQVVVELDGRLAELVRTHFEVPRAPLVRIRVADAGQVLPTLADNSRDVVIRDVFAGSNTPRELTTVSYAAEAARVLDQGGLYLVNCGDTRDLKTARAEAATLRGVFSEVVLVADAPMLKGRRYGNIVMVAGNGGVPSGADVQRELRSAPLPAQLLAGVEVDRFIAGATPIS
ncbi:spermidine synthase [Glutamicibacter endophyticus]